VPEHLHLVNPLRLQADLEQRYRSFYDSAYAFADEQLRSRRGVKVTEITSATTAVGHADFEVEFSRADGVLFSALEVSESSMDGRAVVAAKVDQLARGGSYKDELWPVIVCDVYEAASLTVLISQSRDTKARVRAKAPVATHVGPALLGGAVSVATSSGALWDICGESGMTPLFQLMYSTTRNPLAQALRSIPAKIRGYPSPGRFAYIKIDTALPSFAPGEQMKVSPSPGQGVVVGSVDGDPVELGAGRWGPLIIEPVVVSGAWAFVPELGAGDPSEMFPAQAEFVSRTGGAGVTLRLRDDIPLIVESESGQVIIARAREAVSVDIVDQDIGRVPEEQTAPVEYVDFDAVFDATADHPQRDRSLQSSNDPE
jgi:hypothetical protein